MDGGSVGAGGADRLQWVQGVGGALAAAVDAPQTVVADGVAAVGAGDAVDAAVGRRPAAGPCGLIGVTSGPGAPGVRCGEGPGLYTSAPAYAGWIHKARAR
ncbi:hypothetical protein GCM10010345_91410 [Streptomyces canarius]|uniref:Uncharacterized protein n=1 Tax=Streptomyces canarius TaxID=285453 RepID=A0ABQ3DB57_9ACTN|nr:hypothetical protein GCM10010345_91410 [Streptomyces canarius]